MYLYNGVLPDWPLLYWTMSDRPSCGLCTHIPGSHPPCSDSSDAILC